ncbi:MAG: glycerol-3-phosphate acyltransferase, partial [Oscillospiraceae bacterium]|nr:glycerol-3-phosphate acyltransferase [Oscillospiraceae bacterium]
MYEIALSILMGYLMGSLSPSALFSKIKKVNLRKQGTGNLGATNTMIILGKGYGTFVMLFDIFKAFASAMIASAIFPDAQLAGLVSGVFAVIGHIFPFYLKFRGGKGLAAFGGLILSFDPVIFLSLLILTLILMLLFNYGVAMPISAAVLFPILAFLKTKNLAVFALTLAASALIIYKHIPNLKKAISKDDATIRDYLKKLS